MQQLDSNKNSVTRERQDKKNLTYVNRMLKKKRKAKQL